MSGGGKPKSAVVGYKYYRTLHMGLCHGPVDAIRSVSIKDKVAWQGLLTRNANGASQLAYINQPGLFGGDDLEGGVLGWFEVNFGADNQMLLGVNADGTSNVAAISSLPNMVSPNMPEKATNFRGMAVINFLDFLWGSNPYLSDIAVEVDCYWATWYPEKAIIGVDCNPANMIYQSITNRQWGMGYLEDRIDQVSFRKTADQLYAEGLGLSQTWSEQETIENFIDGICEQIDGAFFFNQQIDKWCLRLVRAGDPLVMTLDPTNCVLTNFSRRMIGETVNELTVRWVNPETEEYQAVTVQDNANVQATGQVIPGSKDYPGVRSENLAGILGLRDLRELSSTLASAEVTGNRRCWKLVPGDLITLNWPLGNTNISLNMRVTQAVHVQDTPDIRLSLVEDVFSQNLASFTGDSESGWVDDRQLPTQFDVVVPFELPFWYVFQASSGVAPDTLVTYGSVLPVSGTGSTKSVTLHALRTTPTASFYDEVRRANVTPSALIANVLVQSSSTSLLSIVPGSLSAPRLIEVDSFAVIGDGHNAEMVRFIGSLSNGTVTIQRGLMDTHPRRWPAGTRVYFIGENQFPADATPRSASEVVSYKATMQTSLGTTRVEDVPTTTMLLDGRQGRPYPVANVTIGYAYWPETYLSNNGFIHVEWATRNRLLQNGPYQVLWNEPSIPPEEGTTVLVFAMQGGQVVASQLVTDMTVRSVDLPNDGMNSGNLTIVIRTYRDGLANYQDFEFTTLATIVRPTGWGTSWSGGWGSN